MLSFKQLLFLLVILSVNGAIDKKSGDFCTQPNGNSGVCIAFTKCASLLQQIRQKTLSISDIEKYRCSFEGSDEISCCVSEEVVSTRIEVPTTTTAKPRITDRKSKKVCDKYLNDKKTPLEFQVWNGIDASAIDFPHTVL